MRKDIATLLKHAGVAIKTMTNETPDGEKDSRSLEEKKEAFNAAVSSYFSTLSSVDVNLRRQIYALEDADIIPRDIINAAGQIDNRRPPAVPSMGSLDVSWLNSRKDRVAKRKEAELWKEARELVDEADGMQQPSQRQ